MSRKSCYLKLEEPINRGEFLELLYDTLLSYGKKDKELLENIPDSKDNSYKSYILNIFFYEYVFGTQYLLSETKADSQIDYTQYWLIENSHHTKNGISYVYLLSEKTELYTRKEFEKSRDRMNAYKSLQPCLQGLVKLQSKDLKTGEIINFEIEDITEFPDYSEKYLKDLKNIDKSFWDEVKLRALEAKASLDEYNNQIARNSFKAQRQTDKLVFAKSLYVYCQVLRYIEDVPKIANRFLEMGNYIDGKKVKSMIMCYFNTDQETGRNGKTYRMYGEENYMQANGFITSNEGLAHRRIADSNVFKNHFFYKDEYCFKDTDSEFLKTINKNRNLRISVDMMYRGPSTLRNDGIFYLAAHNGKINSKLESNERCLTSIRFSDAKYEDNKENLTYIYDDIEENSPLPEELSCLNQHTAKYISELYLDIKVITMTELFDGLLKHGKDITIPKKFLVQQSADTATLNISPELIAYLREHCWAPNGTSISFVRIYTNLAKAQYYNIESAKQEVKKIYNFLNHNYPEYINNINAKNWDNKTVTINEQMLSTIETAIANSVADTDYNLVDQKKLWLYILNMLEIDPNTPVTK